MYLVTLKYCKEEGVYYIDLPDSICTQLGWSLNDSIDWKNNNDGSITLTKIDNTTTHGGTTTITNFKVS